MKATSLDDGLVRRAPWCRTAPAALLTHIKPLGVRGHRGGRPRARPPRTGQAAVDGTGVVAGRVAADDRPSRRTIQALLDELAGSSARTPDASTRSRRGRAEGRARPRVARLDVEVVEHLHMVGDEADRRDDDVARRRGAAARQVVDDVGLEPRHVRRPAAALVDELPVGAADAPRRRGGRLLQLIHVSACASHRERDRVRREGKVRRARRSGSRRSRAGHGRHSPRSSPGG